METVKIVKEEVIEICQKLVIADDNMKKVGGLDLLAYEEEMNATSGPQMINAIKENFNLAVDSMTHGLEKNNTSSKDVLNMTNNILLMSEGLISKHDKLIALANNNIETIVLDPHYSNSETSTTIHTVLNNNGDIVDYVAFDRNNGIQRVYQKDEKLVLDNSTSYGSLKDDMLYGWVYDRDGYHIPGYKSSGYYKER